MSCLYFIPLTNVLVYEDLLLLLTVGPCILFSVLLQKNKLYAELQKFALNV